MTDDARPSTDAWSVCLHCQLILRFTEGGGVRAATSDEIASAPDEERFMLNQVIAAIKKTEWRWK
jgi:hypothetical protein